MEDTEPTSPASPATLNLTRRRAMRVMAGATGTAAVGVGGPKIAPRLTPVRRAEAGLPILIGAAAAGYLIAEGVQHFTGSDIQKEDLDNYVGADARLDFAYKTALQMQDADEDTYTVLMNRIADGWKNAAWSDIKLEIVSTLNDGATEQEVEDAALAELGRKTAIPEENYLNHFSEQMVRLEDIVASLNEHSEIDPTAPEGILMSHDDGNRTAVDNFVAKQFSHELMDGTEIDMHAFVDAEFGATYDELFNTADLLNDLSPFAYGEQSAGRGVAVENANGDLLTYAKTANEEGTTVEEGDFPRVTFWENLQTAYSEMEQDVITFVSEVYPKVQAGEIDPDEMIGVEEFQTTISEGDGPSRAYGELAALGVSVNFDGGGTIRLEDSNLEVDGYLGVMGDWTATVGETYDPSTSDVPGDVYFAFDAGTMTGELLADEFTGSLDGGVFELTAEPTDYYQYHVETVNGEVATARYDEFTENADGNYEADLSDQLDEPIADVEAVTISATDPDAFPNMIQVREPFTVVDYENADGESVDSVDFSSRNTQTTNSDAEALREELAQLRETVEDWEDFQAKQDGGTGGGGGFLDGSADDAKTLGLVALAAAVAAFVLGDSGN